ncbi:B3 domain-containing transcription factor NGA4 [Morus notabilis]|uniref:B3 domain-containing transcription factor NGA4 n=1 Tax=Morus notabilis TaxID=981085 RepID=W9R6P2_9ROSA|nr:B3 domain-containing transcription factor NGA4 [Morus notabilis]EXB39114.1 B3 domain-containing transcription factor NGA4 [Morus notabilis]
MVFTKSLTQTDVESKLMVPNEFFREFPPSQNGGAVDLLVRNQNGLMWTFRMSSIRAGSNRSKLVVSAGWLSFVRDRKLQSGDCLSIYKEGSGERTYRIEVKRRERGKGSDGEWTRLV